MSRKSIESGFTVVSLDSRRPRLQAPPHLPDAVRAIFNEIVSSVGTTHFRACDVVLLTQLATAMHIARQASENIENQGLTLGHRPNPNLGVFERATKTVASLTSKLRIAPSSREDRKSAGLSTRDRALPPTSIDDLSAIEDLLDAEDESDDL